MIGLGSCVRASAVAAALAFFAGGAVAATVTDNVTFSATGFTSAYGDPVPVDPVTGAFQITFDPTQTYSNSTAGISLTSLNITLDSALSFNYSPTGGLADELDVGGLANGAGVVNISPSSNDFYLHIINFTTAPAFGQLGYSQTSAGSQSYYYTTTTAGDSVSVTPVIASGVPEPTTWAMMLVGFFGLGAVMRSARRKELGSVSVA